MENIKDLIDKLNDEQKKPVLDTRGQVLVIAGAGSGKTRVLTTRIAHLVAEEKVPPSKILAITFTNKAAGEMKERLERMIGDVSDMWVSTIHSMCVKILRRDIDKLGYDRNFTIYDETDKDKVYKRVFEEKGFDTEKFLKTVKNSISIAKNEGLNPDMFELENPATYAIKEITEAYRAYDEELRRSNALDFDDLLLKTYDLFCKRPDVAFSYAEKFSHVHIDEFQDTNSVQFSIVRSLVGINGNLFAVGDDDQSIYGWRGARVENMLSFEEYFPNARVYKLEQNYRSTKKILGLANRIIEHNTERRGKELWTNNPDGARIECYVGTDENNEATYAATQIKNLMARYPELKYKDFAVFMRVNAISRAYEQEFAKYGIPNKIFGGFRFFERKEIKDILSYLKVIVNPADDESFIRATAAPKRGIGAKSLAELREFATVLHKSMYEMAAEVKITTLNAGSKSKIANFRGLLDGFREYAENHTPAEIISHIIDVTGFNDQFAEKTEENVAKLYNISELKNTAEQFLKENPTAGLADYLNSMTLSSDTDDINSDDAVTIATIHAAKGLEYKVVFVAGLDEKILPISRSVADDELEEERRLLYVAVTRAMERLYLTRASSRYMYGSREYMAPSRFLNEVKDYLSPNAQDPNKTSSGNGGYGGKTYSSYVKDEVRDSLASVGYSSAYAKTFLGGNKHRVWTNSAALGGYRTGSKIRHPKFGEGRIVEISGTGDNTTACIAFPGLGIKKFALKYAPLEILD